MELVLFTFDWWVKYKSAMFYVQVSAEVQALTISVFKLTSVAGIASVRTLRQRPNLNTCKHYSLHHSAELPQVHLKLWV